MARVDFKKELRHLYNPSSKEVAIVDVPEMNFLMIDGAGDPNTAIEYGEAVEALFAVSYAIKFMIKRERGFDYRVLPLESLWWTNGTLQFNMEDKDKWKWMSMIMQPEQATKDFVSRALEQVKMKKNPPALPKMRFESFLEGMAAQILYIGPYSAEGPTIARIHDFIKRNGYELRGKHHEIYVGDPRRSSPEKLRTILRQPMKL